MPLGTRKGREYMSRRGTAWSPRPTALGPVDRMPRLATRRSRSPSPPQRPRGLRCRRGGCCCSPRTAFANFITPKSGGSPNANQIDSLYKIILYIAAVVFVIVEGALVYSVYKFRAKKNTVAAQIHGNTRLEIGWTVAAALILVVLTVVTFVKLPSIINPPNSSADRLPVGVADPADARRTARS